MTWLFFIVLIDSIGFGIILPLLPILSIEMNFSEFQLGIIVSAFAFAQFLFSPILGILSDKFGRKIIIVICLIFLSLSYYLLSISTTFINILLARILAGIFTGNISIVMASASDLSTPKNRITYMSYIGTAIGVGFILGPMIGGFLAGSNVNSADVNFVFLVASIFTGSAAILSVFFLKETLKFHKGMKSMDLISHSKKTIIEIYSNKQILLLIYLSLLTWFGFASIQVFLTTWSVKNYDLNPQEIGIIGTTFAIIYALMQFILSRFITGNRALILGFIICTIAMLLMLLRPEILMLGFIVLMLAVGLSILFPNLNSSISLYGTDQQRGFILGLSQAAGTLGQSIGPITIGFLYTSIHIQIAWISIAISFLLGAFMTLAHIFKNKSKSKAN